MTAEPRLTLTATVLDSPDAADLARFYQRLLGWQARTWETDWVALAEPGGGAALSFQTEPLYRRPVWPAAGGDGRQQMMSHLDIEVDDLTAGVRHALDAGAALADHQPQDDVRVMLDPAGHPFCLWIRTEEG
ncbi:MAG TPA: VOC family protein [Actinocrinis sp.]|nr:VOC family protein [Actinocrinis sp.]